MTVPAGQAQEIKAAARFVSYGWGMIPVRASVDDTEWQTSLFSKDGLHILPVKMLVRGAAKIGEGDEVTVQTEMG